MIKHIGKETSHRLKTGTCLAHYAQTGEEIARETCEGCKKTRSGLLEKDDEPH